MKKLATFAGGCFWCMIKPFDQYDGVIKEEMNRVYLGDYIDRGFMSCEILITLCAYSNIGLGINWVTWEAFYEMGNKNEMVYLLFPMH